MKKNIIFYFKSITIRCFSNITKTFITIISEFVNLTVGSCKRTNAVLSIFFKKFIGKIKIFHTNIYNFDYLEQANSYTFVMLLLTKKFDTHQKIDELFDKVGDADYQRRLQILLKGFANSMRFNKGLVQPSKLTNSPFGSETLNQPNLYLQLQQKAKEVSLTRDPSGKDYAKFEQAFFELDKEFSRQFCHFLVKSDLSMEEFEELRHIDEVLIKGSGIKTLEKNFFLVSDKLVVMHMKIQNALQLVAINNGEEEATELTYQFVHLYKQLNIEKLAEVAIMMREQLHLLVELLLLSP